jgi:hypothetical protein
MLKNAYLVLAFSLTACSSSASTLIAPSPVATLPDVPSHPACSRKYVSIKMDTFQNCLVDGMHYIQLNQQEPHTYPQGRCWEMSRDFEIWEWADGDGGFLSVSFRGQKMVGKSQVGLASS